MTVRTEAELKAIYSTGAVPTQTNYGDLIETHLRSRNVRPVENFGAVGVPFGDTTTDNLNALQAAIDWSSATGGVAVLGYGDYGFSGTLQLKSNMVLLGQGGTCGHSVLTQKSTSWPNCLASAVSVSDVTGASNVVLRGFCVDGGWDLKDAAATGSNWNYLVASKTQYGIYLDSPTGGADSLNRTASPDTNNRLTDLWVRSVAGNGIHLLGRGEMMMHNLRVSKCAVYGMYLDSPDNWLSDSTFSTIGSEGLVVSGGNQRIANIKAWFVGMCKGQEVPGVGVEFPDSAGITNVDGINITTQDTWGPGMLIEGSSIYIQGRVDNAGGGRLQSQGNGYQGSRTKDRTAVEIGALKDSDVHVQVKGTDLGLSTLPHLVSFKNSAADMNRVVASYYKHAASPYLHSTLIEAVAGMASSKRHNVVMTQNGDVLYGTRTLANLNDVAHSVNVYKGFGAQVTMDTGQIVVSAGATAGSVWKDTTATTTVATPV